MEDRVSVIILAGGKATRMQELCIETPKGLLMFEGKPFLEYLVTWFISQSVVSDVVLSVGHLSSKIEDFFSHPKWNGVKIAVEATPLGTGGGLRNAIDFVDSEAILVCNGDTVVDLPFLDAAKVFFTRGYKAMAVVTQAHNVPNEGAVLIGEDDYVLDFLEGKGPTAISTYGVRYRASSTGCYFLRKNIVIEMIPANEPYSLERSFVPTLVADSILAAYSIGSRFFWDYGSVNRIAWMYEQQHKFADIYQVVE